PLWTHHEGGVQLEEATLAQLQAQRAGLLTQTEAAIASAAARADSARRAFLKYRDDILPKSREVEAMAEESYRAGQTDLPALLQQLRTARELRQAALNAALEYQTAVGELQQATQLGPKP